MTPDEKPRRRYTSPYPPPIDRAMASVTVTSNGCWVSSYAKVNGYGQMQVGGKRMLVHRFVWEYHNGPVPKGLELDHLCRVRACCNPEHLEPVTHKENVRRGAKCGPKACPQGHLYTPENTTYVDNGHIRCRECNKAKCLANRLRRKERANAA